MIRSGLVASILVLMLGSMVGCAAVRPAEAPAEPVLARAENLAVAASMGGGDRRFALYGLREGRLVLAYDAAERADSASTAWDLGFRGTEIIANGGTFGSGQGGIQLLDADFDAVATLPEDGYADRLDARWFDYTPGLNLVTPLPERTLAVRTADGRFAKVRVVSYYRDAPAEPDAQRHEPRFYTFEYVVQPDGSRRVALPR